MLLIAEMVSAKELFTPVLKIEDVGRVRASEAVKGFVEAWYSVSHCESINFA